MIKKMNPVKVSQAVHAQLNKQTVERSAPKSTDPKNFPVFTIPAGKKILVYVPNHVVELEDGSHQLRMDMPILHPVQDGNRFRYFRCISGIVDEEAGYDGSCPLCDGTADPWELARLRIEQKCHAQGLDPEDRDNKEVKAIRSAEFSDRVLKEGDRYYTFPIAVFETDEDCKKLKQDENGKVKYNIMWYNISEKKYNDTWAKAVAEMEDEPETPAGYFYTLSYVYDTKGKQPNSRDAARAFSVHPKSKFSSMKGVAALKTEIDKLTDAWTPEKAAETVISNNLFTFDDLQGAVDDILAQTRSMLAVLSSADVAAPKIGAGAQVQSLPLGNKVSHEAESAPVAMEETDEDFDIDD